MERAFQLASSGEVTSLKDIERQLLLEQHSAVVEHLAGPTLRNQLRHLMSQTASAPADLAEG